MTADIEFIVYSRRGCHLCELLLEEIEPLVKRRARLRVLDVDDDPAWQTAYGLRVPVVVCDGEEVCQYNLDRQAVLERISAG